MSLMYRRVPTQCWVVRANPATGAPTARFITPRWDGRLSHREALARGIIFLSFPPSLSALVKNLSMCAGRRVVLCDWTGTLAGDDDSVRTVRVPTTTSFLRARTGCCFLVVDRVLIVV